MNKVITVSREFGSGGRELGVKLAEALGIPFYDKELISMAADDINIAEEAFREVVGESVTPAENFFEAGATSLNLVQLHVLLQRHEFSTLTLLDLFTHPSPAALADYLAGVATVEKTKRPRPVRRRQRRI